MDWSVRSDVADGGTDGSGPTPPIDAAPEASSDGSIPDASSDVTPVDCMGLAMDVDDALAAAKPCTSPGSPCNLTNDPCGCTVSVWSTKQASYDQAVATYKTSCTPSCGSCGTP